MRLYLLGYMYCGKSTVGRAIASALNCNLVDLDAAIEQHYKTSIPLLFKIYGEEVFRKLEAAVLRSLPLPDNGIEVVSCGGGTPCYSHNIEFINATGSSVYLSLSPSDILCRMQHSKRQRPMFASIPPADRLSFITTQLEERLPYYSQATYTVDVSNLDAQAVAEKIIDLLNVAKQ